MRALGKELDRLDGGPREAIAIAPGRAIGPGQPCFLVAEIGQNHNGQVALARQLIDQAALHAVDAVKFCKRHIPSDLTTAAYHRPYPSPHSFGATYGRHREFLELSLADYAELQQRAFGHGLVFFATACDQHSVDELETLGVPLYKVASRDLTNLPLVDAIARTGKPVILSCGMGNLAEIGEALETVRRHHSRVVLLHCTSAYPTPCEEVNLRAMAALGHRFEVLVGISDHTRGIAVPLAAAALGAVVIEKHVTLDHGMKGSDHAASLEVHHLGELVRGVRDVEQALGDGVKRVSPAALEAEARLGRYLVSRQPIPRGVRLEESMLCLKSDARGLKWRERGRIVGRRAARDIPADVLLREEDFAPQEPARSPR